MRLLGIDYGSKRVGIALSDEGGKFAMPFIVLDNSKKMAVEVMEIAKKNEIKEIVLGESKNYKGEANVILEDSLKFKEELEKFGFLIHLEPEFMTSVAAERFQPRRQQGRGSDRKRRRVNPMIDASAAALILQSYLDKNKNK